MVRLLSKSLSLLALTASASALVTVRKTGKAPTGYEVDFKYTNTTASRVLVGGDIHPFTDQYHTTPETSALYHPREYQAGDFNSLRFDVPPDYDWPYEMKSAGDGLWTLTTPLPSGTYNFAYLVDCNWVTNCSIETGQLVTDPDHPPFRNVPGDQVLSTFQVPFDAEFQSKEGEPYGNFDFALDAPESHRGTVKTVNYTSPGSLHPAPDIHDFSIYLPAEYGKVEGKKYPLLYLSHGAGGNGADWQNRGRASAIFDNLIAQGHIPPTVVVMPTFYNLDDSVPPFTTFGSNNFKWPQLPTLPHIRENFQANLFPWVESHYSVCKESSCRAFAGYSYGGGLAYEMYVNATDYFDYFGLFSPYPGNGTLTFDNTTVRANPALARKGVFVGYGLYDTVLSYVWEIQRVLTSAEINILSRVSPFGGHTGNTWQDNMWVFAVKGLWKPVPFTADTGRGATKK